MPSWHAFYLIGAMTAYFLLRFLAVKNLSQREQGRLSGLYVAAYLGGYFGARILSIFIEQTPNSVGEFFDLLTQLGPMTFYGGAIGAFLFGGAFILHHSLPFGRILDIAILSGLGALAIGRIGCFLNGDDYGIVVSDPSVFWAVKFPNLEEDVARVPVQLLSTFVVGLYVLFVVNYFSRIRRRLGDGGVGIFSIAFYALYRFFAEFLRGDPRGSVGVFSTSQLISVLVLLVIVGVTYVRKIRQPS